MSEWGKVLGRIREALSAPAHLADAPASTMPNAALGAISSWLPRVGDSFAAHAELFWSNAVETRAEFKVLENAAAFAGELTTRATRRDGRKSQRIAAP